MGKPAKINLKGICDSLAKIGLDKAPPPYAGMKAEGWVSAEDAAAITGRSLTGAREVIKKAVKAGSWERSTAKTAENRNITVYREILK